MALERVSSIHVYTTLLVVYTYILPQLWCGEANSSSIWVTVHNCTCLTNQFDNIIKWLM